MRYDIYKKRLSVYDSDDDNIVDWITINGNHIPVYEGQTKYDAASRWVEQKKGDIIGNEYRTQTKNFSSAQHAKAQKKYGEQYLDPNLSGEQNVLGRELEKYHKEQGVEALKKEYKNRDFSVPEISSKQLNKIFENGKIKPEIWEQMKNLFPKQELHEKVKGTFAQGIASHSFSSEQIYKTAYQNKISPEKLYNLLMIPRKA